MNRTFDPNGNANFPKDIFPLWPSSDYIRKEADSDLHEEISSRDPLEDRMDQNKRRLAAPA
jgi:hypothetical protein